MAYTKTTWVDDNPPAIIAANLNKIEQGVEDAHTAVDNHIASHPSGTTADTTPIYIVEDLASPGTWSASIPVRNPGVNPVVAIGDNAPDDATYGITGIENWRNGQDIWIKRTP